MFLISLTALCNKDTKCPKQIRTVSLHFSLKLKTPNNKIHCNNLHDHVVNVKFKASSKQKATNKVIGYLLRECWKSIDVKWNNREANLK